MLTSKPVQKFNILSLYIASCVQPLAHSRQKNPFLLLVPRVPEHSDSRFRWLLPVRHQRPRRRTPKPRDKLAPSHSMTSSARASSDGGMSRPSVLAVLR